MPTEGKVAKVMIGEEQLELDYGMSLSEEALEFDAIMARGSDFMLRVDDILSSLDNKIARDWSRKNAVLITRLNAYGFKVINPLEKDLPVGFLSDFETPKGIIPQP